MARSRRRFASALAVPLAGMLLSVVPVLVLASPAAAHHSTESESVNINYADVPDVAAAVRAGLTFCGAEARWVILYSSAPGTTASGSTDGVRWESYTATDFRKDCTVTYTRHSEHNSSSGVYEDIWIDVRVTRAIAHTTTDSVRVHQITSDDLEDGQPPPPPSLDVISPAQDDDDRDLDILAMMHDTGRKSCRCTTQAAAANPEACAKCDIEPGCND